MATCCRCRTLPARNQRFYEWKKKLAEIDSFDLLLLAFGLLIYGLTRFVGLARFPIYFFCDEAIQANLAIDLLQHGLRDHTGTLLPPFFLNDTNWNLGLSVYLHVVSVLLFGKSVFITRATSVVVSLLGTAAVALTLKLGFNCRFWWASTILLAATPAWFLHSRTAFETVMMVSFYACFLCAYLLYRYRDPRYIYLALLFGAATFYSYANGQGVMFVSGVLLLLSDVRYHLRQKRRLMAGAALLVVLLALPLLRFRYLHPGALESQLRSLHSYWFEDMALGEKLARFGHNYFQGLSPYYWFFPHEADLVRHRIKGMGHLPLLSLPFVLIGLAICLRQWRSSAHRAILVAILAAPFSAALVHILITRALLMVVPAALLTILGLDRVFAWLRPRVAYLPLAIGIAALLSTMSLALLRSALVDGPTWYSDYGLAGMQYGAEQVFTAISEELAKSPDMRLYVSPSWANNTNAFSFFFLNEGQRKQVELVDVDAFLFSGHAMSPGALFVMTSDEYRLAAASRKLVMQPPERIIVYPDGRPGFYFVRMHQLEGQGRITGQSESKRRQ